MPGFKRPAVLNTMAARSCSQSPFCFASTCGAIIEGSQISGPNIEVTPLNPSGATPTMVNG